MAIPWIMILILALIVILGVIAYFATKGEKKEPDYYTFFIIGITWIPLGIATDNPAFWIMGLGLMGLGLANRDKWKERKTWKDINSKQKKLQIIILTTLGVVLFLGLLTFYLLRKGII
ncbi:hypothetical protein GOV04_02975 [Candidatus Woesearchaeota archaeon]|nr:hypothetical protein [Candidatus Woesearchaeota archaeon]